MVTIEPASESLKRLGERLRAARLARNERMGLFADRIGVSIPTLRAMERGAETIQIGFWAKALWALDQLQHLDAVLKPSSSLLERARAQERGKPQRQRASRKRA